MPELPFQGALRIRGTNTYIPNNEILTEITAPPTGETEIYPEDLIQNLGVEGNSRKFP